MPLLTVVVLGLGLPACSSDGSDSSAKFPGSPTPSPSSPAVSATTPTAPAMQTVKGQFHIGDGDWMKTIPGTIWNRCNGQPECDGEECYGVGPADGMGFDTEVLIINGTGDRVALGSVTDTWGWKHPGRGTCVAYWKVEVPVDETGVLTARFGGKRIWQVNFTLAEMRRAPHSLDFVGIGS